MAVDHRDGAGGVGVDTEVNCAGNGGTEQGQKEEKAYLIHIDRQEIG
jgi:hypothetical protein